MSPAPVGPLGADVVWTQEYTALWRESGQRNPTPLRCPSMCWVSPVAAPQVQALTAVSPTTGFHSCAYRACGRHFPSR